MRSTRRHSFDTHALVWAAALLLGCSGQEVVPAPPIVKVLTDETRPIAELYYDIPDKTAEMGNMATGMALADLDNDGWLDMVVSNGNTVGREELTVHYNKGQRDRPFFEAFPDWYDGRAAHRAGLAVGDVDGDGWLDVAVAEPMGVHHDFSTGGIKLYMNQGGELEVNPSWSTGDGFGASGCAFADVDGDGDLDLAVAVVAESGHLGAGSSHYPGGHQRIYFNHDKKLERLPSWNTTLAMVAGDVVAADINQDGLMDLGFAARAPAIFYGRRPLGDQSAPFSGEPDWTSTETFVSSYGIDAGWVTNPPEGRLAVAVAAECLAAACSTSRFVIYDPSRSREHLWSSQPAANAAKLLLADLNADGSLDLIGTQLGEQNAGAPVVIFQGPLLLDGTVHEQPPVFRSSTTTLGQGIAVGDLRNRHIVTETFGSDAPRALWTLPHRRIQRIESVAVVGPGSARALVPYAWAPGTNWISLAAPLSAQQRLDVHYQISPVADVTIAVATATKSNYMFYSQYGD
jgi:hypothetical protein